MIGTITSFVARFLRDRSKAWQISPELDDLSLWGLTRDQSGEISVQGQSLTQLVSEFGSPLLVVHKERLLSDAASICDALTRFAPDAKVLYSYKTNCIPGILRELHDIGIGAEVISPYELWLADQLGVSGDSVVYNGVDKSDESLRRAIAMGVMSINLDSADELARIYAIAREMEKQVRVGVRLALSEKTQFGLNLDSGEALSVCRRIAAYSDYCELTSIHFNVTSNAKTPETHIRCGEIALGFIQQLQETTGQKITFLDIGGGFGVPTSNNMTGSEYGLYRLFGAPPRPPRVQECREIGEYLAEVVAALGKCAANLRIPLPRLLVEPGRFITSRAEFLLSTVLAIKAKKGDSRFAITDAGRLSIAFPCDFEYHKVHLAYLPENRKTGEKRFYNIMGRICTSADWMIKNCYLPKLKNGDILATMDAGAYFSSYSSNFAFTRPAIVLVDSSGKTRVLRNRETFEHLVAMDVLSDQG